MKDRLIKGWNYFKNGAKGGIKRFNRPPIIVGGCGRSGTTMLLSLLSAHPHIFAVPKETGLLCPQAYKEEYSEDKEPRYGDFYRHLLTYDIPSTCNRWCEKTPKNVWFFPQYLDHYGPVIRLIHLVRDGRDVVTSKHPYNPDESWVSPERWVADVKAGLKFVNHPQVLTLRYEDLVRDLPKQLEYLSEFLEEDFSGMADNWHENTEIKNTRAWFDGVQQVNTKSIGKWKLPEYEASTKQFMETKGADDLLKTLKYK